MIRLKHLLGMLALSAAFPASAGAQVDARMLRYPDVSATHITFVYAGDIWIVPKSGGTAVRLSSPPGEESFPRFSPDGARIAYTGNYDGNQDVYVVPTMGGAPTRLTYHPMPDRIVDWHPDGTRVMFASLRESGRLRYSQLYLAPAGGGVATKLPVPYGEFGSFSADGNTLAYMPKTRDFRTWKRYRGGWAPEIILFNLRDSSSTNITNNEANDAHPMMHGNTMYFLSDRGPNQRYNIWAMDESSGATRQVTTLSDFDITFPAIGPEDIVFEAGGRLYLLNLANERTTEVRINVVTDLATLKPRAERVNTRIQWAGISPTGKRATFVARGDLFTVPAEHGPIVNLSRSSGTAERYATWSPDGKTLAYWSDASGEYELTVRAADGTGTERKLTSMGAGYRYAPHWSPDNKKVAFADQNMRFYLYDFDRNRVTRIDSSAIWMGHGQLANLSFNWSTDSRWLTYARPVETSNTAVFLYDATEGRLHQATSGYYADIQPVFDPDGKYLYYLSNRAFQPVYGDFDNSWTYPNATAIVAVGLRKDVASPLAPRNDMEKADGADTTDAKKANGEKADTTKQALVIDLDGFEGRAIVLPPTPGNYNGLSAAKGKVLYLRGPRTGSGGNQSPIVYFDLAEREEKTVMDDANGFELSHDGKKLLVTNNGRWAIVDLKAGVKMDKPLRTTEMETVVDPRAEWRQMFTDAYRFERDFFYDANMHGVDWDAMRDRYGRLIDDAVTRWDVNFIIGELIAELSASHTYRGGGDAEDAPNRGVGMLGADFALENGAYRIKRIVRAAPWDDVRSPLDEAGVDVSEGDYLLAVNGIPMNTSKDPFAAFAGLTSAPVLLTVNGSPSIEGARTVLVQPLANDVELRFMEWIEQRRQRVEEATDGRIGYIYVQSTGRDAQNELVKQFMAQWRKEGLIIDERFNSGGQIPDRFIELLNRPPLAFWATRNGESWQWPPVANFGPKVMLINGWSGSGGDAFPYYFREAKLGPLIGERTWGGLIGISGAPELVDGGNVTVPTFRMYDPDGTWFPEGVGVAPDIPVEDDPSELARGRDPQLERAIQEVMRMLPNATKATPRPPRERR
ncbi:MAG: PDZ domain-containing protein [Gemmatimonadota bacterium]|nr:PDZ domain-containing protein [Gemmatimonadota bacterium]MDH5197092.1 PDZ domain-containing protein [Gemmatimonadota bacterium]